MRLLRHLVTLSPCHLVIFSLAVLSGVVPARAAVPRAFDDAALHAVQFVDANEGWAVGDEGVVWHTIDGGRNWERQSTATRASLRSLHFLNPYTGWIAGREELPHGGSVGVLLLTQDGGLRWRRVLANTLPGLNVVHFVDDKVGYLAGDGSDQYPSGVFLTTDSGRTWQPAPGPRCTSWLAGDFNADGGALAGAWNRLGNVRKAGVSLADVDELGGRNLCGLVLRDKHGIAVGQGGLVLRSDGTSGVSWGFVELGLTPEVQADWDFHAVHGAGKHVWVVGRPGSAMLHSSDAGDHWQIVPTGQPLPLNGVWFHDEARGWAVGELGSVLATTDGGKTWQVQHRGGQRTAILCIHARPSGLAADTLARLGAEDGYLIGALCVTGSDPATAAPARASDGARFTAAVRQAGGAAAESLWQFPLSSYQTAVDRETLMKAWDKLHGDNAAEQLLRQIVLAIRMWQPDVILSDGFEKDPAASVADTLVAEGVREAFRQAGNPQFYPEQIQVLGLSLRKPAKAYGRLAGRAGVDVSYDLTVASKVLESTYRDFATPIASMLAETPVTLPNTRGYRILVAAKPGAETHRDLMESIALAPASLARRPLPPAAEENVELERTLRKRAALQAVTEAPPGVGDAERLLSQLGPMLSELPDQQAAPAAYAAAMQYARHGQWELAREAFILMANRYPAHPLTVDAYRWLVRYACSSEARRRDELGQFLVASSHTFGIPVRDPDKKPEKPKPGDRPPDVTDHRLQSVGFLANKAEIRRSYQGCIDLEPRLAAFGPLFVNDPSIQFCLQAAKRNLGDFDGPKEWYTRFIAKQPDGPWRNAALAELWLLNRHGLPPKPVATCRYTETRPFLDGKLDDACWQDSPVTLHNAAGNTLKDYPTEVRMAYDKEFLYLGVRCFHPANRHVEPVAARKHDEDLRGFDRVSVMLDLDRDYSTCFHFQVDQRGQVAEDCWGDKSWNPQWFVAIHSEPTAWTIEAAIPLVALTGDAVTNGKAWAFNVVRTIPGQGVQGFSLPAEVPEVALRLEGMGLLMFLQDPKQSTAAAGNRMPRVP